MRCEESFITIKLIWHDYLMSSLGNCAMKLYAETGLIVVALIHALLLKQF